MNAASLLELLNVPVAVAATPAQVGAQPLLSFEESLVLASQASPSLRTANPAPNDSPQTQKAVPADVKLPAAAKLPSTTPAPLPVTPQQDSQPAPPLKAPVSQRLRVQIVSDPNQLVQATTAPPDATVLPVASTTPAIVRPTVASRDTPPSSHSPQVSLTSSSPKHGPPPPSNLLISVASVPQITIEPTVVTLPLPTAASSLLNVAPSPAASNTPQPAARPEASLPDSVPKPPAEVASSPLPSAPQDAPPAKVSVAAADVFPVPATSSVSDAAPAAVVQAHPVAAPVVAPAAVAQPHPVASPIIAPVTVTKSPAPPTKSAVEENPVVLNNSASPAVPLRVAPAPVAHEDLKPAPTEVAAPKTSPAPGDQSATPQASPSPENGTTPPPAPVDPLIAVTQPALVAAAVSTPAVVPAAGVANPKIVTVKAAEDPTRLTQHAQPAWEQSGVQAPSQASSQPGDQSQGNAAPQEQNTTPAPASVVNHTPAAPGDTPQNAAVAAPLQNIAPPAAAQAHTAKAPEAPTPTQSALPQQPVPVINTAKLIQTVGQSEMRVGMRSNDFGNISISTSTTRDVISAQISLDHSELAKALATHVPEIQARMGGNQAMDVRIDMNSQAIGQGGAPSLGMSTSSGDGSRGEQQSRGNAAPAQQNEKVHGTASAAVAQTEAALHSRLDVRV